MKKKSNSNEISKYPPFIALLVILLIILLTLFNDANTAPDCLNFICSPSASVLSRSQKFDQYSWIILTFSAILFVIHSLLWLLKLNTKLNSRGLVFLASFTLLVWLLLSLYAWFLKPIIHSCPANCVFPAGIECVSYNLTQNGELTLKIAQGTEHTIMVTGVHCSDNLSPSYTPSAVIYSDGKNVTIPPHSKEYIAGGTSGDIIRCPFSGKEFDGRIYINYTEVDSGQTRIVAGSFNCFQP